MDSKKKFCGATTHTRFAPLPKIFLFLICFLIFNCETVLGVEEFNKSPNDKYMSIDMASSVIERIKVLNPSFNVNAETFATIFNEGFFENESNTLDIDFTNINLVFKSDGQVMYIIPSNNTFSDSLYYMYFDTKYQSNNNNGQYYQAYIKAIESITNTTEQNFAPYAYINLNNMTVTWKTSSTTLINVFLTGDNLIKNNTYNSENETLTSPYIYTFLPTSSFYYSFINTKNTLQQEVSKRPVFSGYYYNNYKPVEEEPGDGGNTSGDTGGDTGSGGSNVDLGNIEQGIGDINNNLGEIKDKIPTSGDINNAIGEITKPYNPEDDILNDMTEEDILDNMGYEQNEDPNQDLWDTIINGLKETLTGSGAQEFSFKLRKTEHTISSDDIYIPNGEIKIYISLFVNFWLLMQMFQFIKRTIDQINEGNLKVMHDVDADCYFF